ncbi:MAG TPA: hypothetical protein VGD26_14065 [Chitinophagaceae bacterium]
MTIVFEQEKDTWFALAFDEIIDGYLHTELLIAEIDTALGAYMVRFESDWSNPTHCGSLDEAKALILRDYKQYRPTSLGRNFFLG